MYMEEAHHLLQGSKASYFKGNVGIVVIIIISMAIRYNQNSTYT